MMPCSIRWGFCLLVLARLTLMAFSTQADPALDPALASALSDGEKCLEAAEKAKKEAEQKVQEARTDPKADLQGAGKDLASLTLTYKDAVATVQQIPIANTRSEQEQLAQHIQDIKQEVHIATFSLNSHLHLPNPGIAEVFTRLPDYSKNSFDGNPNTETILNTQSRDAA